MAPMALMAPRPVMTLMGQVMALITPLAGPNGSDGSDGAYGANFTDGSYGPAGSQAL